MRWSLMFLPSQIILWLRDFVMTNINMEENREGGKRMGFCLGLCLSKATAVLSLAAQGQVILKPFWHNCCHKKPHRVHINPSFEHDSKDPYTNLSSTLYANIKFPMHIFAVKSATCFVIVFFPMLLINLMLITEVCDSQEERARS